MGFFFVVVEKAAASEVALAEMEAGLPACQQQEHRRPLVDDAAAEQPWSSAADRKTHKHEDNEHLPTQRNPPRRLTPFEYCLQSRRWVVLVLALAVPSGWSVSVLVPVLVLVLVYFADQPLQVPLQQRR